MKLTVSNSAFYMHMLIIMCLTTIIYFYCYDRYTTVGNNLIGNSQFSKGFDGWKILAKKNQLNIGNNIMHLSSVQDKDKVLVHQIVPITSGNNYYQFSGEVKHKKIEGGDEEWKKAQVILIPLDDKKRELFDEVYILRVLNGGAEWAKFNKVIKVTDKVEYFKLGAQLVMVTGDIWFKNIELYKVLENKSSILFRYVLIAFWTILILVFATTLKKYREYKYEFIIGSIILGIMFFMPNAFFNDLLWFDLKRQANNYYIFSVSVKRDMVEHFVAYFLICLYVLYRMKNNNCLMKILLALLLISTVIEVLQLFTNRMFEVSDCLSNILGILFATTLYLSYKKTLKVSLFWNNGNK